MAAILFIMYVIMFPIYCLSTLPDFERDGEIRQQYKVSTKQHHQHHLIASRTKRAAVSFVSEKDGKLLQDNGHEAFRDTVATNPGIFLPPGVNITYPISGVMKRIFDYSDTNWENQKVVLARDLSNLYPTDAWKIRFCTSRTVLFQTMFKRCSAGTFFGRMNEVLRNYNRNRDSNLRSFALMLNVILFEWSEVTQYTHTTYRGFTSGADGYQVGLTFAWVDFTTATKNETIACQIANTALFVIDNSETSSFRPRSIAKYALVPDENEFVYPVAVLFHVDRIRSGACGDVTKPTIYVSIEAGDYTISHGRIGTTSSGTAILICVLLAELSMRVLF